MATEKGNSTQGERISLMRELLEELEGVRIDRILGDREFIGEHWVKWLNSKGIGFILRIKSCMNVDLGLRKCKAGSLVRREKVIEAFDQ